MHQGDVEGAFAAGRELLGLQHSSGFEILALAHAMRGEMDQAIDVLENGVRKAPDVWILWQLLGNDYSAVERFEEAFEAYERALQCEGVDADALGYNHGVALMRSGRIQQALARLEQVSDEPPDGQLRVLVTGSRMNVLNQLGRHAEAETLGEREVDREHDERTRTPLAAVLAEQAWAVHARQGPRGRVLDLLKSALGIDRSIENAQRLLRELTGRLDPAGKGFRVLLHGEWPELAEDGREVDFYVTYHVVADSEDAAFRAAADFEPQELRASLRLEEVELMGDKPDALTGVYHVSGYAFYPRGEAHGSG